MDHVYTMFQGDANYVILGEIRRNWSEAFPHLISLIRLQVCICGLKCTSPINNGKYADLLAMG